MGLRQGKTRRLLNLSGEGAIAREAIPASPLALEPRQRTGDGIPHRSFDRALLGSGRYDAPFPLDWGIGFLIGPHEDMGRDAVPLWRVEQVIKAGLNSGAFA